MGAIGEQNGASTTRARPLIDKVHQQNLQLRFLLTSQPNSIMFLSFRQSHPDPARRTRCRGSIEPYAHFFSMIILALELGSPVTAAWRGAGSDPKMDESTIKKEIPLVFGGIWIP